ncbi:hypothetical protein GQX73_g5885 [Xylaria multiplex]|uniref:Uncharacterized protein n=1 Tax=Xylaria multiplex TaxID=323545 RepID=A0A7C8IVY8_9PEZI|nr:hypothetical protein GQX73_g5885 [Xylaria multiplex]
MENLGPLTTTYKATDSIACRDIYLARDTDGFWLQRADTPAGCFPPNFTPTEGYYYSPGICQQGYTYACITVGILGSGTTAATCCPSDFTCRPTREKEDNAACQSTLESDSLYIGDITTYRNGNAQEIGTTTTWIDAGETVYALGVPVRRAATDPEWSMPSTDLGITTTRTKMMPTNIESTSKRAENSITPSPSGTEKPPDSPAAQTGLSTGVKAAIGIGATLGLFLFLAAVAAIYYIKERKRRASALLQKSQEETNNEEKLNREIPSHELEEQREIRELNADRDPAELTAYREPAELG